MKLEDYQNWLCGMIDYCRTEEDRWDHRDNPDAKMFYEWKKEAFEMAFSKSHEIE